MTAKRPFILVSFEPVDGYPPVQYQARLLAAAGHAVHLVTRPRRPDQAAPDFTCPGVTVHSLSARAAYFLPRPLQALAFARLLYAARRATRGAAPVEIAYNHLGIYFSCLTPGWPDTRVAHFHETFRGISEFHRDRLRRLVPKFDLVVVADPDRVAYTAEILRLPRLPIAIENYPMLSHTVPATDPAASSFDVVYCGSLGLDQRIDVLIASVPLWPAGARLILIGDVRTSHGARLQKQVETAALADRVLFTGWMELPAAEARMARAHLGVSLLDSSLHQWRTALGASNKRYQYMKAGLPQIGDLNPGVKDLLEGQGIGTCIRAETPEEIARVVRLYATDPERRAVEGARAFALHQTRYNYARVFERLHRALGTG